MENKRVCAFVKILYRFFTKRKNNDEISQYYVKNSHDETISPEIYGLVQRGSCLNAIIVVPVHFRIRLFVASVKDFVVQKYNISILSIEG